MGSTAVAVPAFGFTVNNVILGTTGDSSTTANARCAYTHEFYYRTLETDPWTKLSDAAGVSGATFISTSTAMDFTTLAFSILTAANVIATPGDSIASRYVRRAH